MDIGRTLLSNTLPRHRLDAGLYSSLKVLTTEFSNYSNITIFFFVIFLGTFGTMGVGLGFAVASALWCQKYAPGKRVICVEGDSAFGFSGMEVETMFR